jgi:hypothetical protein
MVGTGHGMFYRLDLSGLGEATELVVRPTVVRAGMAGEAAGGGSGDWPTPGEQPGLLWLPADPRATHPPGTDVRSQDRVGGHAPTGLALAQSLTTDPVWAATRGAGARGRTESTLGLGHHEHPSVGRSEGTLGDHDRLCGSDGVGLALRHADHRRGSGRDAARSDIPAMWGDTSPRTGDRVSQRQRARIYVASVPAIRASHGAHPLSHAPAESAVEWMSRGLLRQLQTG